MTANKRYLYLYVIFIALFGFLAVRLCYLAYGAGNAADIMQAASGQYLRNMIVASRRGFIYDRNGTAIAGIPDGYITVADPVRLIMNDDSVISDLAGKSNMTYPQLVEKIRHGIPFKIYTHEEINTEYAYSVPNYQRYADASAAAHIIGYIDGSGVGVKGAEFYYEKYLSELSGGRMYLTYHANAVNNMFGSLPLTIYDEGYTSGGGIILTLDIGLQREVERIFTESADKGAVVIADGGTGELLVSASFPTYDLNNIADYIGSENGEFVNRCAARFTPGSIFKIVTACAALEYDKVYLTRTYECTGEGCYAKIPHGEVDMIGAFAHSCNAYFVKTVDEIGTERLYETAVKLGFGDERYKYINLFYAGCGVIDVSVPSNAAIGQGGILCTPYEITRLICSVLNYGKSTELSLLRGLKGNNMDSDIIYETAAGQETVMDIYTAGQLKKMMKAVVNDGIGQSAKIDGDDTDCGGKTASAQSGQTDADGDEIVHSWFAGYYDDYVITVLCEGGGSGNGTAALIFAEITRMLR